VIAVWKLITDAQRLLNVLEIFNVKPRRKFQAAAQTFCLFGARAFFFVELHADLRGPLEDVKELPKWEVQ
jgi:hypothetical protein